MRARTSSRRVASNAAVTLISRRPGKPTASPVVRHRTVQLIGLPATTATAKKANTRSARAGAAMPAGNGGTMVAADRVPKLALVNGFVRKHFVHLISLLALIAFLTPGVSQALRARGPLDASGASLFLMMLSAAIQCDFAAF